MDSYTGFNKKYARCVAEKINRYLNRNSKLEFRELKSSQQTNNFDCGAYMMLFPQDYAEAAVMGRQTESLIVNKDKIIELREML